MTARNQRSALPSWGPGSPGPKLKEPSPFPALLPRGARRGPFGRGYLAAHGNSLRALVKYLDNVSDADIVELNIPTGQPLVYELDSELKPIRHYYLGDPDAIKAAMQAVANQGKSK